MWYMWYKRTLQFRTSNEVTLRLPMGGSEYLQLAPLFYYSRRVPSWKGQASPQAAEQ